jgi:hypothetical protein
MSDKPNKKKFDGTRISSQPHELEYWNKKWKISIQQLNGAKRATESDQVKKIEKYLRDIKRI